MEPTKEHIRFYIYTRYKLGITARPVHEELVQVYGDRAPSFRTVARWIQHFHGGREAVEDEPRAGRPRTSVTDNSVQRAEALIEEDPTITLRFLALELGVSFGSAHAIVHEQLGRSKRCARWVPHQLAPEEKKKRVKICRKWLQDFEPNGPKRFSDVVTGDECWISFFTMKDKRSNMVWMTDDEPRPEVLKTSFRSRKRMSIIFFNFQEPVAVDIMPDKATITATYYTTSVLPKVLEHIQSTAPTRRRSRIMLHHDNASPHKARLTQTYLDENGIHLMEHPPYSPDLAPCDFWLFPKIKSKIAGRPFSRIQDLAKAVHSEMRTIPTLEYRQCFEKWRMRMQRCIDVEGSYFEGM